MKRKAQSKSNKELVKEAIEKSGFNAKRYRECVNLMFLLADLMESYSVEADALLLPLNGELSSDLRNSIQRIKIHSHNLVGFVDKTMNEEFTDSFGDVADALKDYLENVLVDRDEKA